MKNTLKSTTLLFVLLCMVVQGCTVWRPLHRDHQNNMSLPEFYQGYYDYPVMTQFDEKILRHEKRHRYDYYEIEIPLALPAELVHENLNEFRAKIEEMATHDRKTAKDQSLFYTNRFSYYLPNNIKDGEKRPVVLISPILGGNMVVDLFAGFYAQLGFISVIVHRKKPYLSDGAQDFAEIETYLRSTIIRLRGAIDWLEYREEVNSEKIVSFGVSYGAILHSVLAVVEPRVKYHILAMPAGHIAETIIECPDRAMVKLVKKAREQFNWTDEEVYAELKKQIKTDPFYLAPYIPKEKVQVYIALFDKVVGSGRSWDLWREMNRPNLKIMPFGHYGGVLIFPYLQLRSYLSFLLRIG